MKPEEIRELLGRHDLAILSHDIANLTSCYADDCALDSATAGPVTGRDAVGKDYGLWFTAFPDLLWQPDELVLMEQIAVQTGTMTGTDTGGFLGQAPTGNQIRVTVIFIFKFRNGKITHLRRLTDRGGILMQLASEAEAAADVPEQYQELLERTRREHDLRVAAEVQQALAPPTRHEGRGFMLASAVMPCRAIGGDFLDYFELADGSLGVVLGDVAGKGPPAALLAALLQGVFASHIGLGEAPAEMLAMVNQVLIHRRIEDRFSTGFYGALSPSGEFTYCNAGGEPPILVTRRGLSRLDKGGLILGAFSEATYEQETLQLEPGDVLAAFSDGVTEAFNEDGDLFGDDRLTSCLVESRELAPAALIEQLFGTIDRFRGGADQNDDISALVVRYEGA
jgi:serine phosphatase RsbU (regulator of sigma subunit)